MSMYKRSVFNITIINNGEPSTKEVNGMIWGSYGFYKEDGEYYPIYIPSGYSLPIPSPVFNFCKTAKKAKEVIMVYKDFFGENVPLSIKHNDFFDCDIPYINISREIETQLKDRLKELF